MQLMMVVLPVPGPPVMTSSFSWRAAATAWACSSERSMLPGLHLGDQIFQMQGRGAAGRRGQASQGLGHPGLRHPGDPFVNPAAARQVRQGQPTFPGLEFQGPEQRWPLHFK